jgi:hypothetical protein
MGRSLLLFRNKLSGIFIFELLQFVVEFHEFYRKLHDNLSQPAEHVKCYLLYQNLYGTESG